MASGEQRMWHLVPPGSPPSAPELHSKAKNKPFVLLQSLEPPRGPDYFPMERFRTYGATWHERNDGSTSVLPDDDSDDPRTGIAGFHRPRGLRHPDMNKAHASSYSSHTRRGGDSLVEPSRDVGGSRLPPNPATSATFARILTPARSSGGGSQQQGFSLFGGAAFSTPGSSGSAATQICGAATPSSSSSSSGGDGQWRGSKSAGVGGIFAGDRGGGDGVAAHGGNSSGIARFRPMAGAVGGGAAEKTSQQARWRDENGDGFPSRALRRPSTGLALSSAASSPPAPPFNGAASKGQQLNGDGVGRVFRGDVETPSPASTDISTVSAAASRETGESADGDGRRRGRGSVLGLLATTVAEASPSSSTAALAAANNTGRKRQRAPLPSSPSAAPESTVPSVAAAAAAAAAIGTPLLGYTPSSSERQKAGDRSWEKSSERSWGSLDSSSKKSVSAGASAATAAAVTRHPQEKNRKCPKPSPRGKTSSATVGGGVRTPTTSSGSRSSSPRPKKASTPSPRGRGGSGPRAADCGPAAPAPLKLTLTDFEGADEICFNAGASSQALSVFLERCEARGIVAVATLWADLTTSFSPVTVKSCLPSQTCRRWNCACGRQPRACQATAPIIAVVVYIPAKDQGLSQAQAPPPSVSLSSSPGQAGMDANESVSDQEEEDFLEAETYVLPLGACHGEEAEARRTGEYQLPIECQATYDERWRALATLFAMPAVKKVIFNAQVALMPFIAWTMTAKTEATLPSDEPISSSFPAESTSSTGDTSMPASVLGLFDPRVAAWMTDTGSTEKALEFEALCHSRLPPARRSGDIGDEGGGGGGGAEDESRGSRTIATAVSKIDRCCRRSISLAGKLSKELHDGKMLSACEDVEMPAIPVLAAMEVSGVVFLPERVTRFSEALGRHLDGLRRTARTAAGGRDFNLASPDQVAELLFKSLQLPSPPVKAGSTHASTSAEVLEGLLGKHPVVAPILEFRGVNKLKTTYVDKLAEKAVGAAPASSAVPASQGIGAARIHAAWNQTSVRTGRLSCARPNLQQIPKGSDPLAGVAGVNIRDAFAASRNFTLMAADYSQIEMRVLADACRDPGLASLFASLGSDGGGVGGGDVYRRLAAQVFGKEEETVSESERTRAKVVCLGIIYGMGTPQVARKLGVSESQAQGLVRSFLKKFPRIEPFLATTRRYAREKGYVCTLTGRRRHLPEINNARSAALKAQAERQAVNSVVQGTAADIIKSAMVLVAVRLDQWRCGVQPGSDCPRMIMQIHDELVFECPAREEDLGKLKGLLKECMEMETPARLGIKCPLTVNMLVGMSWGSMRPVVVVPASHNSDIDTSSEGDMSDGIGGHD